jgi:hypothetical protein
MKGQRDDLVQVRQRVYRYWYEDGLAEIAGGSVLALVGLYFWVQSRLPADSLFVPLFGVGFPILVLVSGWLARHWVRVAKERWTYPRTGYVQYHRPGNRRRWLTVGIGVGTGILITLLIARGPIAEAWLPALAGTIVGAGILYLAHTVGLIRFYVLASLSVLLGIALSLSDLEDPLRSAAYFGPLGMAWIVAGSLTLSRYLRLTQPPMEEGEHGR